MFAIVGLGNPGTRYEETRHNAGFWVVDFLARQYGQDGWKEKNNCLFQKVSIAKEQGLLIKPQKYMNLSGECCLPLLNFFKISIEKVTVVYDELDLKVGVVRVKSGGGSGGHNGVEDMIRHLGGKEFSRIRLGIGRPGDGASQEEGESNSVREQNISDWVLSKPRPKDQELLNIAVENAADAAKVLITQGLLPAQNSFNRS